MPAGHVLPLCVSLVGLLDVGFQRKMFWGLVSQVQVLKVGVPEVGVQIVCSPGRSSWLSFPPDCGSLYGRWGLRLDCVPTSLRLLCRLSLISLVQTSCSGFRFFSEKVVQYVVTDSACLWKEMSLESS